MASVLPPFVEALPDDTSLQRRLALPRSWTMTTTAAPTDR